MIQNSEDCIISEKEEMCPCRRGAVYFLIVSDWLVPKYTEKYSRQFSNVHILT